MHDLEIHKSRQWEIKSRGNHMSMKLFVAICLQSLTKHKPLKKDVDGACRLCKTCKYIPFSLQTQRLITACYSRFKWRSNQSLTPSELNRAASSPDWAAGPLMLCRNATRQSICFPHATWQKRRGHARIPLMFESPRAGVVDEWEGIER